MWKLWKLWFLNIFHINVISNPEFFISKELKLSKISNFRYNFHKIPTFYKNKWSLQVQILTFKNFFWWNFYHWIKKPWFGSFNPTIRLNQTWLSDFFNCPVTNVTCVTECVTRVLFRLSARLVKLQKLHFLDRYTIPYIKLYTFQSSGMRVPSQSPVISWLLLIAADYLELAVGVVLMGKPATLNLTPSLILDVLRKKVAPTYFLTVLNLEQLLGIQLQ